MFASQHQPLEDAIKFVNALTVELINVNRCFVLLQKDVKLAIERSSMDPQSSLNATLALVMLEKLLARRNNVAFMEFLIDLLQHFPAIVHHILFPFVREMEGLILQHA